MSLQDSTTENPAILKRLKQDFEAIKEAMDIMDALGGIAYHGMVAGNGGEHDQKNLEKLLKKMKSPWTPPSLQENAFQIILKLAGDAYSLLSECADPEYVLKKAAPAGPQA